MRILKLTMLAFGFILLNAASCCKDENEETLPPETQTGANTFGCLVNGKVWLNGGYAPFPSSNLYASVYPNEFVIGALKSNDNMYQSIFIDVKAPISIGKFNLNSENHQAKFADGITNCYYQTDSISSKGTLEITKFDSINKIVSGQFSFIAFKYKPTTIAVIGNCDSTINITEGRFDIKYIP